MASSQNVEIVWKDRSLAKVLSSGGMESIMETYGKAAAGRATAMARVGNARYGMRVTQGRRMRAWKARVYTANFAAIVDTHKHNTLTKVI